MFLVLSAEERNPLERKYKQKFDLTALEKKTASENVNCI